MSTSKSSYGRFDKPPGVFCSTHRPVFERRQIFKSLETNMCTQPSSACEQSNGHWLCTLVLSFGTVYSIRHSGRKQEHTFPLHLELLHLFYQLSSALRAERESRPNALLVSSIHFQIKNPTIQKNKGSHGQV